MQNIPDFILFDDDPVNNTLCYITIKNVIKEAKIKTFTVPEKGLQYISKEYTDKPGKNAILFLDINMHGMTCWEFLELFENYRGKIKGEIKIYILTASFSPVDKERAAKNKNISEYIEKPLTAEKVRAIIS